MPTPEERLGKFICSLNDKYRMTVIDTHPYHLEDVVHKVREIEYLEEEESQISASMNEKFTSQTSP